MSTVYLFRHGQTNFNQQKKFTGWLQSDLTPQGLNQAQNMAILLKGILFDYSYSPNLTRCLQTLSEVLKYHPECRQPIIDDRILERNYGQLGGKLHQDIINEFGIEQFNKWHRGWSDRPPEGESYADVEVRIKSFIEDLQAKYSQTNNNIVICGSSNSIRLFRKIMEGASIEEAVSWTIPYDQYFEYSL